MIYTASHLTKPTTLEADLCVIGTGAGAAPVIHAAAKQGKRVVALEAGRYWRPKDFTQLEHEMFPRLYHDQGGRTTHDKAIHVHQGKGVGGSTLHNLNLCRRIPKAIEAQWREQQGLTHLSERTLDALYSSIEQTLSVSQLSEANLSSNNRVLKRGVEALKYRGGFLKHNRVGCAASGFCELGCPFDAKQNALKAFVAPAVEAGAMVLSDTWGHKLLVQGRRVTQLNAYVRHPQTGEVLAPVTIRARAFCASASATGTPTLLQRSAVPDPHRLVGSRLFLHPAVAVAGTFEEALHSWQGVPQSYECTEFLDFSPHSKKRLWILPAFAHPVGVSSILSGFGQEHHNYLQQYKHMAAFTAMLHDETTGSVSTDGRFGVRIHYWPNPQDRAQLMLGLRESARIMLAAGAKAALIPFSRTIEIQHLRDVDKALDTQRIQRHDINLTAVHPMGSVWMGDNPRHACVSSRGRYHHLDNLFVSDTSLFPTSTGGPPQLTAYSLGLHVANNILSFL